MMSWHPLSMSVHINVDRMSKDYLYDFLEWKDRNCRTPEVGKFNTTNVLVFLSERNASATTMMYKKDHIKSLVRVDILFPTK